MSINIKKINIIVETNIENEAPFSLTYDKIYNPVKSRVIKSQTKLDYPYFTPDIEYNEELLYNLAKKDYSELLRAFFDKRYFTTMIKSFKEGKSKKFTDIKNQKKEITNHNIFMMLYFLFPIRSPPANISSSYNSKICKNSAGDYQVDLKNKPASNTLSSLFLGKTKDTKEENVREYSYINTSKGESTVTEIIWLNDVLNNPKYRELVDTLIQYDEWVKDFKSTIDTDIENAQQNLFEKIRDDDVRITNEDIQMIIDQKKTNFSINTLIDNIKKNIKSLYVLPEINDEQYSKLDNDTKTYIECLYSAERKLLDNFDEQMRRPYDEKNTKRSSIFKRKDGELDATLIIEFVLSEKLGREFYYFTGIFGNFENKKVRETNHRDRLNNTPNGIMDFYKESNDKITIPDKYTLQLNDKLKKSKDGANNTPTSLQSPPPPPPLQLARFSSADTDTNDTCKNFRNNDEAIYNLRQELKKSKYFDKFKESIRNDVDKFNTFSANQGNARFIAQYRDVDNQIDKSVTELRNIMTITKDSSVENNVQFKNIMNSVDFLKTFFSDESVRQNRLSGISSIQIKIEKIFKMTNEIKALQLTKTFFDKAKGINLYYDKEQTKTNIELVTELKKEKYFYFTNTVKFIKEKFINSNSESTNDILKKYMNTYFNNTSNELIDVVEKAKLAINNNNDIVCNADFNTLVTKIRPSNNQQDPEFEINIYMEVIIGEVDYQTQQNIKCEYRDKNLTVLFNELTTNPNDYEIIKKTNAIELPKAIKDVKTIAVEKKNPPIPLASPPAAVAKGGLRKRNTCKHQRRNYNFTRRRR